MATKANKATTTPATKNVFVLDDGTKEITLVNPFGKVICKLHIRTGDIGIYDRYKALMANFDSIVKPLSEVDITASGEAALDEMWELVKKVEDNLKQRINELFDMDEADAIFATRKPFASVNGHFFAEIVLNALGEVVRVALEEETKLSAERVKKHLDDIEDVNGDAGAASEST